MLAFGRNVRGNKKTGVEIKKVEVETYGARIVVGQGVEVEGSWSRHVRVQQDTGVVGGGRDAGVGGGGTGLVQRKGGFGLAQALLEQLDGLLQVSVLLLLGGQRVHALVSGASATLAARLATVTADFTVAAQLAGDMAACTAHCEG